jgi:prepilin-type processing-associated H-X9-DG protein
MDDRLHSNYKGYGYSGPKTALEEPLLQLNQNTSQASITDGMGNTFMLFESAGKPYRYQNGSLFHTAYDSFTEWSNWKASFMINPGYQGYTCGKQRLINCTNIGEIYSFHPGGATFLYGDGGVKFESEEMAISVFVNRFTRAGGEMEFRE